ncbi:MAG: hypothetical protein Q4C98_11390, partial [Capnocytophaga sp.]|nr:hypothetical protein [Capnocytophaga sp.]
MYREKGKSWKSKTSNTAQVELTGLKRNKIYIYKVGIACGLGQQTQSVFGEQTYLYSAEQEFFTEQQSDSTSVQCGIKPEIRIKNREPLQEVLGVNETFTAGDFPVTIISATGSNGVFSGEGYVQVPYLLDTKIKVVFSGIKLNTERQLIEGKLVTTYDGAEGNVEKASAESKRKEEKTEIKGVAEASQENLEKETDQEDALKESIAQQDTNSIKDEITGEVTGTSVLENNGVTVNNETSSSQENNEIAVTDAKTKDNSSARNREVYFSHKNVKYKDKDTITLPFNRNKKVTLGIEGIDKNEYVNWLSKDGLERTKYISGKKRTVNTEVLNSLKMLYYAPSYEDFLNKKYDTLQAFLRYKHNDFTIEELYARDITVEEGKREAKSGETLYLISGAVSKDERSEVAEYEAVISPKLKEDEFPTYHLKWDYGYPHTKSQDEGKLKIRKPTYEKWKGLDTISITGGYPNPVTKKIMVKTIYENRTTISAMPPGVSEVLTKRIKQIGDQLRFVDRKINLGMKFKIDPIKISGETYNQEMKNSPLYEEVREWSITGGMTAQANTTITHPVFNALERANILRFGIFASMGLTFGVKGTIMQTKPINNKEFKMETSYADIFGIGCLDFGIVAQLLVAKETIDCEVKGYAKGCLQGRIRYDLKDNKVNSKESSFFIPPVVLGFKVKVKSKGWVEFELVDFEG